jgi:ubiquitin-protein ligase
MTSQLTKRLQNEYHLIKSNPYLTPTLPTNDLKLWHVEFLGVANTIYAGERFRLQLKFSDEYVR